MENNFSCNTNNQETSTQKQHLNDLPTVEIAENAIDATESQIPYKPSVAQTTVAAIMCVLPLLEWFIQFFGFSFFSNYQSVKFYSYMLFPAIGALISALCFGYLGVKASNRATEIATYVGVGLFIIHAGLLFMGVDINSSDSDFSLWHILKGIILIYMYALIIQNNDLSEKNRIWINTLIVLGAISNNFMREQFVSFQVKFVSVYSYHGSFPEIMITLVSVILLSISYWHFARCEAFSGRYNSQTECTYSPFNKWIAAGIIVPAILLLCMSFLYKKYQLFI